jgi:hypothetical protein
VPECWDNDAGPARLSPPVHPGRNTCEERHPYSIWKHDFEKFGPADFNMM